MKATCLVCNEFVEMDNWVKTANDEFGVCPACLADAKLGRLVRRMPRDQHLARRETTWVSWRDDFGYDRNFSSGLTPEKALEKAMGEGK